LFVSDLTHVSPLRSSSLSLLFWFCSNWHWVLCYSVVASAITLNPNSWRVFFAKGMEVGMLHTVDRLIASEWCFELVCSATRDFSQMAV